ncbi:uncharacterized protein LOC120265061 [Dioscorea cayenensis subsp. rotundata]|uniref:Uncharacterized protein LOC120265061 n=1 Tax=Dioscorea cayennensis subsp. rotundata TaxID=55577 RepID=A0AB40BPP0_DIOCR|nr:uncharacterized protein LOC120265061 [Dioscorea cayenensis subsp. rotundata]
MAFARWCFDACIPFNAMWSPYFQQMVDAIGSIGVGYNAPSYNDMRVNLLHDCKKECQLLIDSYRSQWANCRCTIMGDGISFVKSVDASDILKDATNLCNLFMEIIEWVGQDNVVHLILEKKRSCSESLYHDASKVTIFVYNHIYILSWLRKRSGWKEIVRPGVTRFATTFITLKSIYDHKHDLQALVTNKYYTSHKISKSPVGKTVTSIILDGKFWEECLFMVKIAAPIIRFLRVVDADEKPSLGYVYEGMIRIRKAIMAIFRNKSTMYGPYIKIIDERWDKHLRRNLHAAAYFLNPAFLYDKEAFCETPEVMQGLLDLLEKRSICSDSEKAMREIRFYRDRLGNFSRESALSSANKIQPNEWWRLFGYSTPFLQKVAI